MALIERPQARHSTEMERAFLIDDVEKLTEQSRKLRTVCQSHWRAVREFLTFFDTIRFCRYLVLLIGKTESKSKIKNERLLFSLRRDRFGNALRNTTRHILNLSDYDLYQWFSNCASRRPGASFQFSKGLAEYFGFVPLSLGFIASKEL